jgi:hypothetical protein
VSFSALPRGRRVLPGGVGGAVLGGVVEHEDLGLEVHRRPLARDRVQAVAQQPALLGVDDAEGQLDAHALHTALLGAQAAPSP